MTLAQRILALVIVVVGIYFIYNWHISNRPSYWEAVANMEDKVNHEHAVNADQLNAESEALVAKAEQDHKVSSNADLMGVLMPSANRGRDLVRIEKAYLARIGDRDESVISTETEVYQNDWAMMREIRVPTYIQVVGQISPEMYPQHRSTPDGIDWDAKDGDRTVLMEERGSDELAPDEKLNEAIGKLCDDENGVRCRPGLMLGAKSVLCVGPGLHEGGFFSGWYNGLQRIGGTKMNLYFSGAIMSHGKLKFVITPDDPAHGRMFSTNICAAHPGALVVQITKQPQASTTTLAANTR